MMNRQQRVTHIESTMKRRLDQAHKCEQVLGSTDTANELELSRLAFIINAASDMYYTWHGLIMSEDLETVRDAYKEILRIGSLYA